jgi:hypothetical protein
MLQNLIFTLGGVLVGGVITWFYYKRSGKALHLRPNCNWSYG